MDDKKQTTQKNHNIYFGLILVIGLFIDRLTKALAVKNLKDGRVITVIPNVFDFRYVENRGAAFGSMQGKQVLFYIVTCIVVVGIIYVILKAPKTKKYLPLCYTLTFILCGAIGNFIDRITQHFVVDFIYFIPIDFPVFNVADIFVTLGSITLLYLIIFVYKDKDFDFLSRR